MSLKKIFKWQAVFGLLLIFSIQALSQQNEKIVNRNLPELLKLDTKLKHTKVGGLKMAFLKRETPNSEVIIRMKLRFGNEKALMNRDVAGDFAGQLLMRGTKKHTRKQLEDEFKRLNTKVNISGDVFSSWVSVQTTRPNLTKVLSLIAEILREPAYPKDEFEKLKAEVLKVVGNFRNSSQAIAGRELGRHMNTVPKGHPNYSGSIKESYAGIKAVTLEETKNFYKDFYGASNGEMTVVGDFDMSEIVSWADRSFSNWKSSQKFERVKNKYKYIKIVNKTISAPTNDLAHFVARVNLPISENHEDYPALLLGTYIFGHPAFQNSHLAKRFAQNKDSKDRLMSIFYANPLDSFGGFIVFGNYAPKNREEVESIYNQELNKVLVRGFTEDEILEAKNSWLKSRQSLRTNNNRLASHLNNMIFLDRNLAWDYKLEQKIKSLTPKQINKAMKKHINPNDISIVKAGNFPEIREKTKKQKAKK